jgi:hypothetical protein
VRWLGVEALVRWRARATRAVSPDVFIPIAERTGLILPLGAWVLRESIAQMHRWDRQAPESRLVVNVNISTRQLERPGLLAVVDELVAEGWTPPGWSWRSPRQLSRSTVKRRPRRCTSSAHAVCAWPWTTSGPATPP